MRDFDPGQPLHSYRALGAGVELYCTGCALMRTFPLEAVIQKLAARGYDEWTGIRAVAALTTEPCPRCGGKAFESRPDFSIQPEKPTEGRGS